MSATSSAVSDEDADNKSFRAWLRTDESYPRRRWQNMSRIDFCTCACYNKPLRNLHFRYFTEFDTYLSGYFTGQRTQLNQLEEFSFIFIFIFAITVEIWAKNATVCCQSSKLWRSDLAIDNALRDWKIGANRERTGRILTLNDLDLYFWGSRLRCKASSKIEWEL